MLLGTDGQDMNTIHPVLTWVNLVGDDIREIKINSKVLLSAFKDISLGAKARRTKYMEVGCHRDTTADIMVGSSSYEKL
jgi:hypothetical protein